LSACADGLPNLGLTCGADPGTPLPVVMRGPAMLVRVRINEVPQLFMIDTGGARSVIERRSALALGLTHKMSHIEMRDVAGLRQVDVVGVNRLQIGEFSFEDREMIVSDGLQVDGLIGLDILSHYDLDIDEPHKRMTIYRHGLCQGSKPDIGAPMIEMEAIRGIRDGRTGLTGMAPFLLVAAKLDDTYSLAMLDTGALGGSVVSQRFADAAGTTSDMLDGDTQITTRGLGPGINVARHRFKSLDIGGEVFAQPYLLVTQEAGAQFPLILGTDYFHTHRVWLNFAADRVFSVPIHPVFAPAD
jgi:hypothetical protein